jgi:hypothetical protein
MPCIQVGGPSKDFNPEVYREQIRANQLSKVNAARRAYTGAGAILSHPGDSRPASQQVPPSRAGGLEMQARQHATFPTSTGAPALVPPDSVVPADDVTPVPPPEAYEPSL